MTRIGLPVHPWYCHAIRGHNSYSRFRTDWQNIWGRKMASWKVIRRPDKRRFFCHIIFLPFLWLSAAGGKAGLGSIRGCFQDVFTHQHANPKYLLFVPAILIFSCAVSHANEPIRRSEDVVYGRKSGMALTLDVFQPARPNSCGLLFLVNGGWLSSKDTPKIVTIRPDDYSLYLERGYTVFAIVTSSQPKFAIPEQIEDVHRAVRFVRANAAKVGVRPDRLGSCDRAKDMAGATSGNRPRMSPRSPIGLTGI